MTKSRALREFGGIWKNGECVKKANRFTKKVRKEAFERLKSEVVEMNMYIHGEVYGVIITCLETEEDDSCWGFYCDGREELCRCVKYLLPRDMTGDAETAVIESLEWAW
jgi:hypothetical protein